MAITYFRDATTVRGVRRTTGQIRQSIEGFLRVGGWKLRARFTKRIRPLKTVLSLHIYPVLCLEKVIWADLVKRSNYGDEYTYCAQCEDR